MYGAKISRAVRLLVTGGAGFIGSNFVRMAVKKGRDVVVLDKLTYAGNLENLRDLLDAGRIQFLKGDVCDPASVSEAIRGAAWRSLRARPKRIPTPCVRSSVCHAAGRSRPPIGSRPARTRCRAPWTANDDRAPRARGLGRRHGDFAFS